MNTQNLESLQALHGAPQRRFIRTAVATAVLAGAGFTSFGALAAGAQRPDAAARAEIQQTYRAERAACTNGSSTQERGACLAEAAAVRKEAMAGVLGMQNVARNETATPGESDLLANALARCDAIPSDVRTDCERRVIGGDAVIVVGSVAEGGILRELAPAEPAVMVAQAETRLAPTEPVNTAVAEPTEPVMENAPATTAATAAPASNPVVADAGLSQGETLVPTDTAQATGQAAEPLPETLTPNAGNAAASGFDTTPATAPASTTERISSEVASGTAATNTGPNAESNAESNAATTVQPGNETLPQGSTQPLADMANNHPAVAPALAPADSKRVAPLPAGGVAVMSEAEAAAEAQAQADAQRLEQQAATAAQPVASEMGGQMDGQMDSARSQQQAPETQYAPPARGADPVAYPEWMVQQRFE